MAANNVLFINNIYIKRALACVRGIRIDHNLFTLMKGTLARPAITFFPSSLFKVY